MSESALSIEFGKVLVGNHSLFISVILLCLQDTVGFWEGWFILRSFTVIEAASLRDLTKSCSQNTEICWDFSEILSIWFSHLWTTGFDWSFEWSFRFLGLLRRDSFPHLMLITYDSSFDWRFTRSLVMSLGFWRWLRGQQFLIR